MAHNSGTPQDPPVTVAQLRTLLNVATGHLRYQPHTSVMLRLHPYGSRLLCPLTDTWAGADRFTLSHDQLHTSNPLRLEQLMSLLPSDLSLPVHIHGSDDPCLFLGCEDRWAPDAPLVLVLDTVPSPYAGSC